MKIERVETSEMSTFVAMANEAEGQGAPQNLTTIFNDEHFEVFNAELSFQTRHEKLPCSDMKIVFETPAGEIKTVKAHKVIMAHGSELVAKRIQNDESRKEETVLAIAMKVVELDMKRVLDLIYTGKSGAIAKERRNKFMELMSFFQIQGFKIVDAVEPPMMKPLPLPIPVTPRLTFAKRKGQSSSAPGQKVGSVKKVKVEKMDPENGEKMSEEELAWIMPFNVIPAEEGAGFCVVCGKMFSQMKNAKSHFKKHHTNRGADTSFCQGCGIELPTGQMIEHYKTQPCGSQFNESLKQGHQTAMQDIDKFIIPIDSGKGKCLLCEKEYSQMKNAKSHYKNNHSSFKSETEIFCISCGQQCTDIVQHYKNNHKVAHKDIIKRFDKLDE